MKTIQALILFFAFLQSEGQSIDKKLLIGHWDMYAFGKYYNANDIPKTMSKMLEARQKKNTSVALTASDTLEVINKIEETQKRVAKCFMEFDAQGHFVFQFGFDKNEQGNPPILKGTYKWVGGNKIRTKDVTGETPYLIEVLSQTTLKIVIGPEEQGGQLWEFKKR